MSFCDTIIKDLQKQNLKIPHPLYVIQKHFATRLHYDLRLEFDGVLKSWAVPKEPILVNDSTTRILAVEVNDHDILYGMWEGTIPPGNYGAGKVERYDIGTFTVIDQTDKKITVDINGNVLNGVYCLIKFQDNKWLFYKKKI